LTDIHLRISAERSQLLLEAIMDDVTSLALTTYSHHMSALTIDDRMRGAVAAESIRDLKQIEMKSTSEHDAILLRKESEGRSFGSRQDDSTCLGATDISILSNPSCCLGKVDQRSNGV
jgi:hypothetical protein